LFELSEERRPTFYDYMAASTLAGVFVWIWGILLRKLPQFSEKTMSIIVLLSFFVYALGGAIASYMIVKRSSGRPLFEGIKVGTGAILILMLVIFPSSAKRSLGVTLAIMLCVFVGSIIGTLVPQLKKLYNIIFAGPKKNK